MAQYFESAVVLTQNSGGHSTNAIASNCTLRYIIEYLETAKMPPNGTVCEVTRKPLIDIPAPKTKRDVAVGEWSVPSYLTRRKGV
jgi:hypothetical protein